ncbi:MAG: hypothetical protein IPL46_33035 [Saprospiraceae bacterium]|nr:hypothetical protein [Saprospiraceae bacterium]
MKRIIVSFLVLSIAVGAAVYYYTQRDSRNDIKYQKAEAEITASVLYAIYSEDEDLADSRYLGKVITVSGQIVSVDQEDEKITISLDTDDPLNAVVCEMNTKIQADFSDIREGHEISIKGECSGKLMDIILVNCILN